eukprot:gb/GECH01012650.1/.p1 GENE.gb/GECH01012650.1/~~gb/GECH01012650.1/.p1  ORF type:complete len:358 (+),score=101.67 gb/GECH01012650.1/:1-1074(+)
MTAQKERVAVIGSGNWGSTIAKLVGEHIQQRRKQTEENVDGPEFESEVKMWVYEEEIEGKKLTEIINSQHENVKYLPNVKLPENIIASPDAQDTVKDATLLIFVLPHQFVPKVCNTIKDHISPKARAISLIKGMDLQHDSQLISSLIKEELNIDCSVLTGAHIAKEVAAGQFTEATLGYYNLESAQPFYHLFNTRNFKVSLSDDPVTVELCGTLKNIVAIAVGLVDGLEMGLNTKSSVMRIGLREMQNLMRKWNPGTKPDTLLESCGVADLITTCFGGRNRRVAEHFARNNGKKSFEQLEQELLQGQKIQGTLTAKEVHMVLKRWGVTQEFPLFTAVYEIAFENKPPQHLFHKLELE